MWQSESASASKSNRQVWGGGLHPDHYQQDTKQCGRYCAQNAKEQRGGHRGAVEGAGDLRLLAPALFGVHFGRLEFRGKLHRTLRGRFEFGNYWLCARGPGICRLTTTDPLDTRRSPTSPPALLDPFDPDEVIVLVSLPSCLDFVQAGE